MPKISITRRRMVWLALLAVLLALAVDAFWLEPASLRVVEHDVPLQQPGALSGLRVVVIADLHAGAPYIGTAKIDRVVSLAQAQKPDLILLAGDYVIRSVVGGTHMSIEEIVAHLKPLSAPLGVYAVIGNHDRWENAPHIAQVLQRAGIAVLENRSVLIHRGKREFVLAGIGDFFTQASDPARALSGVQTDQSVLCFTHSPDVFPLLPGTCTLTIAGHTHGGQVDLPFVGRLIVPSKYGQRYAAGLIREDGRTLFVSTGIGTSIIPVRFSVPPEVTLISIHGANGAAE